jgi:hypothetical protein
MIDHTIAAEVRAAGSSAKEELPIFLPNFSSPVAVALFVQWSSCNWMTDKEIWEETD